MTMLTIPIEENNNNTAATATALSTGLMTNCMRINFPLLNIEYYNNNNKRASKLMNKTTNTEVCGLILMIRNEGEIPVYFLVCY